MLFGAKHANAPVSLENVPWEAEEKRNELKSQTPTGTFPFLTTPHGNIAESNAILAYLAESYNPQLLGANAFEKAQVRQWVEFGNVEIGRAAKSLIYPLFGWGEQAKAEVDEANKQIKNHLAILNKHLEGKTYIVGSNVTLADIILFNHLRWYMQFVFVEDMRKKLFPNITTWFVNLANQEQALKAYGRTVLCKVPAKAPKVEKKEEPKKEKKEEPKKEKKEGEEPKKKANPLDLLPPSSFVLDEFKRDFLNTDDKVGAMKRFWENFDANGYSFWWMQYQKLASEGKILFKTCNSSSFFLQKLDPFRKYCFAVHGVYGTEGNYEVRGCWMWRGLDIPDEVKEHDNFPYMDIKKLDASSENDRKFVEDYWLHTTPGEVVDGLPVAEVVYFK